MRRLLASLVAAACAVALPATRAQNEPRVEWIDVHMHLIGGQRGDFAGAARAAIAAKYRSATAAAEAAIATEDDGDVVHGPAV